MLFRICSNACKTIPHRFLDDWEILSKLLAFHNILLQHLSCPILRIRQPTVSRFVRCSNQNIEQLFFLNPFGANLWVSDIYIYIFFLYGHDVYYYIYIYIFGGRGSYIMFRICGWIPLCFNLSFSWNLTLLSCLSLTRSSRRWKRRVFRAKVLQRFQESNFVALRQQLITISIAEKIQAPTLMTRSNQWHCFPWRFWRLINDNLWCHPGICSKENITSFGPTSKVNSEKTWLIGKDIQSSHENL